MGYQKTNGQWADTQDVSLHDGIITATGNGAPFELGDRGTLRLALVVASAIANGTNAKQSVAVTGATGGTFKLTFGGKTTAPIAHNASAATVLAALESLESIGAGNVACTGGALGTAAVVVEFVGALRGAPRTLMTADGALLTGAGSEAAAVTSTQTGVLGTWGLVAKVETSRDGVTWVALSTFATLSAPGNERKIIPGVDRYVRATFTVTGTSPEITCSLSGEAV